MNLSAPFIKRPVATTLLMLALVLSGLVAYRLLPVAPLPQVEFPTISVTAALPGASPETMAAAVATPLERQFSTIAGIDNMTSSSSLGSTQVTIQFALAILAEAALSYLGLGTQPPQPSWGRMLSEAQTLLFQSPMLAVYPGVAIALAVLGLNLLGDGLRDLLDPRLTRKR